MSRGAISSTLRRERGSALVIALAIVLIGMLLGLGAAAYALSVNGQSVHDERTRGAQQAADAGTQQQLYLQSNTSGLGYSLNGGVLGTGSLLQCTLPPLSIGLSAGSLVGHLNSSGQCVSSATSGSCTSTSCAPVWTPVDNEDYYESEFFANPTMQGSGNDFPVEFPDVVSLGCHTTASTSSTPSPTSSCAAGSSSNSYSRQHVILQPIAPLQTVEGGNDVTVNSGLSSLSALLTSAVNAQCVQLLGIVVSCNGSGLLGGLGSLLSGLLNQLGISTVSYVVNNLVSKVAALAVVDGNISAGNQLSLPSLTVDVNTSTGTLSGLSLNGTSLSSLGGVLSNLTGTLANPGSLFPTFDFGKQVCKTGSSSCTSSPSSGVLGSPVAAVSPHYQQTTGPCTPGQPSTSCSLQRPAFSVTTAPPTSQPAGITHTGSGSLYYNNGSVYVTGGSVQFAGGSSYVLCGFYAASGVSVTTSGSGGVQIFVVGPGSSAAANCPTSGSNYVQTGDFVACSGVSNLLGGGDVNAVTGAINPSGFQIYVQGSGSKGGTGDTAVTSCPASPTSLTPPSGDPSTQVYLGDSGSLSSPPALEGVIVYAPSSEVTINTTLAFVGSAIGWNVDLTALAILQDLDLGNYPLASVVNAYQPAQTVQCDNEVVPLQNAAPTYGSGGSLSTLGDLKGC